MTIDELTNKLGQERGFGSRFPVRMIFTGSLQAYTALENLLKATCDVTINIADFCKAQDLMPQFDKMSAALSTNKDKHVLLLSVGEYLRLCTKRELDKQREQFKSFWEQMQSEASLTRYIVPVFSCRDIFDRIISTVDERQQDFVWTLDNHEDNETYNISVYSPEFKDKINPDAKNLVDWLRNWRTILGNPKPCTIVTSLYRNAERSFGAVTIQVFDSPFRYLRDYLIDGNSLVEKWGNAEFWVHMIEYAKKYNVQEVKFYQIVLDVLNINSFDFISIIARWKTLDAHQKTLIWMWYRIYPTEDYFCYACKKATTEQEIPDRIRDEILKTSNLNPKWIEERMAAMKALSFPSFDDSYFALLDKLTQAESKLKMLTYETREERTYAIKVISSMLREGAEPDDIVALIRKDFQILATYMTESLGKDTDVDTYMAWYRKNKLINRYPGDPPIEISFERFDTRFKLLHKMQGKDCFTLWIDGFGIEWAPAFLYQLKSQGIVPKSVDIAVSLLPTETEYNHQWDKTNPLHQKWDRLDSFSHKGRPDDIGYYSCIADQLSVLEDAAKKVDELLQYHEYVAVTGDHGSSRLAALAFHDPNVVPIATPAQAVVHSFGRFCELGDNADSFIPLPCMTKSIHNGKTYIIMNNYQHFQSSGNAAGGNSDNHDVGGEIHGGNTTEERLVPVIIFCQKHKLSPITCIPKNKIVTKKHGRVEAVLEFNIPISTLEVYMDRNAAECIANTDGSWKVIFDDISEEQLELSVIANGCRLPNNVSLKVKTQGIKNNDLFSGMEL